MISRTCSICHIQCKCSQCHRTVSLTENYSQLFQNCGGPRQSHPCEHHLPAKAGSVDSEAEDVADAGAAKSPGVSPAPSSWDSSVVAVESAMVVAEACRQDWPVTGMTGRRSAVRSPRMVGVMDLTWDCSGTSRDHRIHGSYRRKTDNSVQARANARINLTSLLDEERNNVRYFVQEFVKDDIYPKCNLQVI